MVMMFVAALAFSLFWHVGVQDGASFFFMAGFSNASSPWGLFWMRGVSLTEPYKWWHGFGLTFFPALCVLTVFLYIPLRAMHWLIARMRGNIHNRVAGTDP